MTVTRARYFTIFSVLSSALILFGCSKKVERSQLLGNYQATHQSGVEMIELKSDGRYTHQFKRKDSTETTASDIWEFEPYDGEPKVALHNFKAYFPQSPENGTDITLLGVEKHWGKIRLYVSYDRYEYYSQN
jgi:hypothetical protein